MNNWLKMISKVSVTMVNLRDCDQPCISGSRFIFLEVPVGFQNVKGMFLNNDVSDVDLKICSVSV